jgi:hypothetical protein
MFSFGLDDDVKVNEIRWVCTRCGNNKCMQNFVVKQWYTRLLRIDGAEMRNESI